MKTSRNLAVALVAVMLAGSGPVFAAATEQTIYDAPQHQDAFFSAQRAAPADVDVTGSLSAPSATIGITDDAPFWAAHEAIRLNAQDHH